MNPFFLTPPSMPIDSLVPLVGSLTAESPRTGIDPLIPPIGIENFGSSSMVEQPAVNRLVAGSSPACRVLYKSGRTLNLAYLPVSGSAASKSPISR